MFDYPDSGYGPGYLPYPAAPTGLPYDSEEPPVSYGAVPLPGAPVVAGGPGAVAPAWGYPGAPEEKPARKSRRKWAIAAATVASAIATALIATRRPGTRPGTGPAAGARPGA